MNPPRTVVILRALQLGDLLCTVPAFKALRTTFPESHIALIGLPWAAEFVDRFGWYIDEHIEFPGYPGLPERQPSIEAVPPFLAAMQRRRFDLVLQMHGSGSYVNEVAVLLGGRQTAGFFQPPGFCPDERLFLPYPDGVSEIHRHLRLMEHLGLPLPDSDLEFPITTADEDAYRRLEEARALKPGHYICLHPGGRGQNRRWAPEQFAVIADQLVKAGHTVVVTGTAQELAITRTMREHMQERAIVMTGRTDLGTLGVLLRDARLLVANDTGVSHLAAALKTPSVIVCVGSDPVRWGPLDRTRHRVLAGAMATIEQVWHEIVASLGEDFSATGSRKRDATVAAGAAITL